jgi:hypothetical protein
MTAPPAFDRLRVPGEEDARRRAWTVAQAALADRPRAAPASHVRRGGLTAAAVTLAAVIVALGLTAPGRATAEWVRHHLSEVTGHDPRPPRPAPAASPYSPLPGGGRLLSTADDGLFAFGLPGGAPRKLIGPVDAAAWSPHGRFVAAVRGIELIAVDLRGRRRWSLAADHAIRWPAWSPSGFRVAYVVGSTGTGGRTIRVVAGDGTGDRVLAASGPTPPAWQPGVAPAERLATVDSASRVTLRDADSGHVLWRARMDRAPLQLAWTAGGRRLLVLQRTRVVVLDGATGARLGHSATQTKTTNIALAPRPRHQGYAVIRRTVAPAPPDAPRARVTLVRTDAGGRRVLDTSSVLFAGGPIRAIAFSPHGDWLAADLASVDGWDLVHLRGRGVDVTRTLAAGRGARLAGWCCGEPQRRPPRPPTLAHD